LTFAARLFGAELQHPGVEKDITILWCKSAADCEVRACVAPGRYHLHDTAVQEVVAAINSLSRRT
jgi:hypothetical protein